MRILISRLLPIELVDLFKKPLEFWQTPFSVGHYFLCQKYAFTSNVDVKHMSMRTLSLSKSL